MNIPIFYASDNNYAPYLAVSILSVCKNAESNIDFYILDGGLDEQNKKNTAGIVSKYSNCNIEFIKIDENNIFDNYIENSYFTKAVYWRLLIPALKPNLEKVIYIDIDTIVNLDIKELYGENLDDFVIGAIYEEKMENYHTLTSKKNLKIPFEHKYFNSGILLIDCNKWRNNKITDKIVETYKKYKERIFFPDQDLLNIVFSVNQYKILDNKYNYLSQNPVTDRKELIYHYDGCIKPWEISQKLNSNIIEYLDIWWNYAKETPYLTLIEEKCKYKDQITFRVARAKKALETLNRNRVLNKIEESGQ